MLTVSTGPVEQIAIDILSRFGGFRVAPDLSREALLELVREATALVVRGDATADAELIARAPQLRVIGRTGAGYNNVDVAEATRRGIPVIYVPGAGSRAVAEGTMTFLLALFKRLPHWDRQTKAGNWGCRNTDRPADLEGATLGILGFGRIGQLVATLAAPFRMEILAHDPCADAPRAAELGVRLVGLDELFARSRAVTIHAPLTPETKGIVNRQRIALMPRGGVVINMARGGLVESMDALLEPLESGHLLGVGLDVFEPEPPDHHHPIFRHPGCLVAPHVLGVTEGAMYKICESMAEDMAAVLRGDTPRHVVNREALGGSARTAAGAAAEA